MFRVTSSRRHLPYSIHTNVHGGAPLSEQRVDHGDPCRKRSAGLVSVAKGELARARARRIRRLGRTAVAVVGLEPEQVTTLYGGDKHNGVARGSGGATR